MLKTKTALTLIKIIIQLKLTGIICRSANINFNECEAATMARLKIWLPCSDPKALLVGNYVHSYFESSKIHDLFKRKTKTKCFLVENHMGF